MIKRLTSIPEAGIIMTTISLMALFSILNPRFLSPDNITSMLRAMAYPGIIAIGLALCLISGTIDISVGATAGFAGIIFSKAMVSFGATAELALLAAITAGFTVGMINSVIIINFQVTPFIATISMMYVVRGMATFLSKGYTIYPISEQVAKIGNARIAGVSWAFIVMVILMIVAGVVLARTVWGLCVRATGSDIESARCNEVDVKFIQRSTLVIASMLAALAGVFITAVLNSGVPSTGTGWELSAIAACAIGGVSLFGYEGSMVGLFFGLLTMQVIMNGIVMAGISSYLQIVVIGVILLVSMIIDVKRRRYLNLEKI